MDLLFVLGSCKRLFCFRTSIRWFSNPAKCLARSLNATCGFLVVGFLNFDWCNSPDFWNITPSQTNKYCAKHQSEFWCSLLEFGKPFFFSALPNTNSEHLKMDAWETASHFHFEKAYFRASMLLSGRVSLHKKKFPKILKWATQKKKHSYFPVYCLFNRE